MAKTRTLREALSLAMKLSPRFDDSSYAALVADLALSFMWRWYAWDESMVQLPPVYMTPDEPDIEAPARVVPGDFWYLDRAWIKQIDGDVFPLRVLKKLDKCGFNERPRDIAYEAQTNSFRFSPTPSSGWAAPHVQVEGVYKKTSTKVTTSNLNSLVLPWDDMYFGVFLQSLRYQYMLLNNHPDTGQVGTDSVGRTRYSGQLARFVGELHLATAQENQRGDDFVHPEESLMLG